MVQVIPGAQGYGSDTVAGRGGAVIRVTNLNASGVGSLDYACRDTAGDGDRTIIFDVSGLIDQGGSPVSIAGDNVTIAGQTAPYPGITLKNSGISTNATNVLIQHIKVRPGDGPDGTAKSNRDAMQVEAGATNIYLDHCSFSWSIDGLLDAWGAITNITAVDCIFAEALRHAGHPDDDPEVEGGHSMSTLFGAGVTNISLIRNVMANSYARHPLINTSSSFIKINCLTYNASYDIIALSPGSTEDFLVDAIGNRTKIGPATIAGSDEAVTILSGVTAATQVYVLENDCENYIEGDDWASVTDYSGLPTKTNQSLTPTQAMTSTISALSLTELEPHLLANCGAWPAYRDITDTRILADTQNNTGAYIDSPADVEGWDDTGSTRVLELPADYNVVQPSGYTNLELWLHDLAASIETGIDMENTSNLLTDSFNTLALTLDNETVDETGDGATLTIDSNSDAGTLYSYSKTTAFTGTEADKAAEIIANGVDQVPVIGENTRVVTGQDSLTPHYAGWVQDAGAVESNVVLVQYTTLDTPARPVMTQPYPDRFNYADNPVGSVDLGATYWSSNAGPLLFRDVGLPFGLTMDENTGIVTGTSSGNASANVDIYASNTLGETITPGEFVWKIEIPPVVVPPEGAGLSLSLSLWV